MPFGIGRIPMTPQRIDPNQSRMFIEPAQPPPDQVTIETPPPPANRMAPQELLTQPMNNFDRNTYTPEDLQRMGVLRGRGIPTISRT